MVACSTNRLIDDPTAIMDKNPLNKNIHVSIDVTINGSAFS